MNTLSRGGGRRFLCWAGAVSLALFLPNTFFAQTCTNIAGTWLVEEASTITYNINGQITTTQSGGTGPLDIEQTGCSIHFVSQGVNPIDGSIITLSRDGTVAGNIVTYTGQTGVIIPGASCSQNYVTGTGVINGNTMTVTNVGKVLCSVQGIPIDVTISGTAVFTRMGQLFRISGEIRLDTPTGPPVRDVTVRLTGSSGPRDCQSDANGRYVFDALPPGAYVVAPASTGYVFTPRDISVSLARDTQLAVIVANQVPAFSISRIWSDQVPGIQFNSLPPDSATGAGTWGNHLSLIVMGARADGLGRVQCSIKLDPADTPLRDRLVLKLIRAEGQGDVLADASWTGDTASFSTAVAGESVLCTIQGWVDMDRNGAFNPETGETLTRAPGNFVIVSQAGYAAAKQGLRDKVGWGLAGAFLPLAYRFVDSFLNNSTPEHSTDLGLVPVSAVGDLDHNVGVQFAGGSAFVHEYGFDSASDVAARILAADAIQEAVLQAVAANSQRIAQAFQGTTTGEITFPLLEGTEPIAFEFPEPDTLVVSEWDLYYAFHGAAMHNATVTVRQQERDRVRLRAVLTDTYDFRWNAGEMSALASKVQAGFPTLGNSGEVFRIRVVLDGAVRNVRYDAGPSLTLGWAEVAGGQKLLLECTHRPGTAVFVEYSTDLSSWQLLQQAATAESVSTIDVEQLLGKKTGCYFRAKQ
jgi:hypothetical protein